MMQAVFIDTTAWIALLDDTDMLHQPTLQVMQTLRQRQTPLVTTELVVIEMGNALAAPTMRMRTIAFLDRLRRNPDLTIIEASEHLIAAGWELYRQRPDKAWGLIDAVTGEDYLYRPTSQRLTPAIIQRISDLLVERRVDPQRQIIGSYRLLRDLESDHGFDSGEAQHILLEHRRARVKRYRATGYTSYADLQRACNDLHATSAC